MFSNDGFEFVISNIITFLILCSETILHSSYIYIPGKQVAVNSHQLYPQNQPQLPKKMVHYVFQVYVSFCHVGVAVSRRHFRKLSWVETLLHIFFWQFLYRSSQLEKKTKKHWLQVKQRERWRNVCFFQYLIRDVIWDAQQNVGIERLYNRDPHTWNVKIMVAADILRGGSAPRCNLFRSSRLFRGIVAPYGSRSRWWARFLSGELPKYQPLPFLVVSSSKTNPTLARFLECFFRATFHLQIFDTRYFS